jgi:hypothetical protein
MLTVIDLQLSAEMKIFCFDCQLILIIQQCSIVSNQNNYKLTPLPTSLIFLTIKIYSYEQFIAWWKVVFPILSLLCRRTGLGQVSKDNEGAWRWENKFADNTGSHEQLCPAPEFRRCPRLVQTGAAHDPR